MCTLVRARSWSVPPSNTQISTSMIPSSLRELIRVSRKTAREFKQALEDVAELIREKQLEQSLQREPVRVPVRNQARQHPLAGRVYRRQFSTTRDVSATFRNINKNVLLNFARAGNASGGAAATRNFTPSLINTLKAAVYQTQPFRTATRVQMGLVRGGIGSGMYRHFPRHNARMFSTFGPNMTRQAVENLSQGLRTFFVKGGKTSHDCLSHAYMNNVDIGHLRADETFASNDIELASTVSETAGLKECGCIVEFDMATPSIVSLVPESGYFDDDLSCKMETVYETSIKVQQKVLNDIMLFRENIGSTSYKFDKQREKLRFYCPNCEVTKMERLLLESCITMGVVKKNESFGSPAALDELSDSEGSEFSGPELETDSDSILSATASSSGNTGSSVSSGHYNRYSYFNGMEEFSDGSILSTSDEFFEVSSTAIRV